MVKALGEGKSIFDPNSQCYPQGMPDNAHRNFELVTHRDRFYMIIIGNTGNEMRTIWMDGRPMPKKQPYQYTYNGDSIGQWEGDTLVIETRNITGPNTAISPNLAKSDDFWTIERWTPVSEDLIDVSATFKDEQRFTAAYTEKYQFKRDPKGVTADQPRACVTGEGQRYIPDAKTGELLMTGPGGKALEKAED